MNAREKQTHGRDSVLFLHAGVADSRMWQPQVEAFENAGHRVIAPDLRGFGEQPVGAEPFSHVKDVEGLLDREAAVVGNSLGGRVALELALHRPDLVSRLVLIAPGLPGWEWSEQVRAGWALEGEAFDRGDLDAAAEASVHLWVDGPSRSPDEVDPGVRSAVREMVLRSYELELDAGASSGGEEDLFDTPVADRLAEIRCPTLVLVGEHDVPDMHAIASRVAGSIEGAKLETVPDAAHLPSLERPDECNAIVLAFLTDS
jgi:3-oxoadipate enol-lactonase